MPTPVKAHAAPDPAEIRTLGSRTVVPRPELPADHIGEQGRDISDMSPIHDVRRLVDGVDRDRKSWGEGADYRSMRHLRPDIPPEPFELIVSGHANPSSHCNLLDPRRSAGMFTFSCELRGIAK